MSPGRPALSVVVVLYEMYREAPRTLHTLSAAYQRGVAEDDYEVIVVDNGSSRRREAGEIERFGPQFSYRYVEDADRSPVPAINEAVRACRGELVGICHDGARMLSPGLLALALRAARLGADPYVITLGWHLGPDVQYRSQRRGYDRDQEDRLLDSVDWREDGYRLFGISALGGSNPRGWFGPVAESPVQFIRPGTFERIGGFEEGFGSAAGGIFNLDFLREAVEDEGTEPVVLLGEGSFHQLHGAEFNNAGRREHRAKWAEAKREYKRVRGRDYEQPALSPLYLGSLGGPAASFALPGAANGRLRSGARRIAEALGW